MNKQLTAVAIFRLKGFENGPLAALNTAIQAWGTVEEKNLGYQPAVAAGLIEGNGKPYDLEALRDACAFEVNHRVRAGTFD